MDQDHLPNGCTTGGCSYHLMRTLRCLDIPGVDVIWRQIYPGQEQVMPTGERIAQNGFFPRYASSAMEQIGGSYAMSETFAVYGNGLTYALMRHCLGYQAVRGINVFNMMLISYGRHGYMQAGEQPTFHEALPYFADLAGINRYAERLSYVVSVGERVCDTALYYPVSDFWVNNRSEALSRAFEALGRALEDRGIDFDIVDDDVLADAEGVDQGQIRIGKAVYTKLVVPSEAYLCEETRAALARFCAGGGKVLIKTKVIIKGDQITFDFTGTDPQNKGPHNCVPCALKATVYYAMLSILDKSIPANSGFFDSINVVAEEGSIVWAKEPAPTSDRETTTQRIADVIFGELPPEIRYPLMERCIDVGDGKLLDDPCDIGYPGVKETIAELAKKK